MRHGVSIKAAEGGFIISWRAFREEEKKGFDDEHPLIRRRGHWHLHEAVRTSLEDAFKLIEKVLKNTSDESEAEFDFEAGA